MRKLITTAAAGLLVVAVLAPAASATDQPVTRVGAASTTRPAPRATLAASADAADSPCDAVGSNLFNRTYACAKLTKQVPITKGQTNGVLEVVTSHDITLDVKSRTFTDNVSLQFVSLSGTASVSGLTFSLSSSCSGTCTATVSGLQNVPVRIGSTASGTVTFTDSTTTQNSTKATYAFAPGGADFNGTPFTDRSPTFRCDNLISQQGAGCVFSGYIPTMTSMSTLPDIAANIRAIQAAGPSHYGRKADGKPLTRSTDDALRKANRDTACPTSRPRPTGMSCDEYPFARTNEGASKTQQPDWGWAWVPVAQQSSQGGKITAFWKSDRVLNSDPFWVTV